MAIQEIDLSGNTFTLTPMNMTDNAKTLLESIISNIERDKGNLNVLQDATTGKLNEVINEINTYKAGNSVNFEELQNKIDAIVALESEAGNDSFVGLFTKLFTELNNRKEILMWSLPVTSTTNGQVGIDLTEYGFASKDDYEIMAEVKTHGKDNISCSLTKVSATLATVTIRDEQFIQFGSNANSFYSANDTDKKVELTLLVSKVATPIFGTVTEVDGDVDEFGTPLVPAVQIIDATVASDTGIYTFHGEQGTELNTVLTVVGSDGNVSFTIDSTDGTNEFTVTSDSAPLINGSIQINKAVDGVNAPSRVFNYVSAYPQTSISMLTVDANGNALFAAPLLNGGTLSLTIDGTEATVVLDADGNGTISDFTTKLTTNGTYDLIFDVELDGKTSITRTKSVTISDGGNNAEL